MRQRPQTPAHRQPDQQRQQRQADEVGQQAAPGDLADQLAAHVAALAEQNPQIVLAVVQQEQPPGMAVELHVVIAAAQMAEG